jgi:hypothetical protein
MTTPDRLTIMVLPRKKPVIMSNFKVPVQMTTWTGNKDCIVGLPNMPAKHATKEEVPAKKDQNQQEKAEKVMADLKAIQKVAAIEDSQSCVEAERDTNANHPAWTSIKCIHCRITTVKGFLEGLFENYLSATFDPPDT